MTESAQTVETLTETLPPTTEQTTPLKDPAEVAAQLYTLYLPRFLGIIDTLSNKQLKRLIKALIETPLMEEQPKFSTQDEKTAFAIGDELLQAKMALVISALFGDVAMKQLEASQTTNEETKEETNGKEET